MSRPRPRTVAVSLALALALAACGGQARHSPAPTTTAAAARSVAAAPRGRLIVFFRRALGVDPLASYFKLYSSGDGIATVVYGGRDGARVRHFTLAPSRVQRIERLLRGTRLHDSAIVNASVYTYWVITNGGSYRLQQGAIPKPAQPLLAALDAIAEANHLD